MALKKFSARMKYFELRKKFIAIHKDKLVCFYCGDAVREYTEVNPTRQDRLTIDHMRPIAYGGDPFSFSNFRICCGGCNNIRGRIQCYMDLEKKHQIMVKYMTRKKVVFPDEFFHYIFYSPLKNF